MSREPGFYWVKFSPTTRWVVIEWIDEYDGVWLVGDECEEKFMWDTEIHEVDEARIKSPEES